MTPGGPGRFGRSGPPPGAGPRPRFDDRGQASVELALVLPLVLLLLLLLVEAGLVVRDQVLVVHAAREAVRVAAVQADPAAIEAAAVDGSGLAPLDVDVQGRSAPGARVTVTVRYDEPGRLPFLRSLTSRLTLSATATMRVETV